MDTLTVVVLVATPFLAFAGSLAGPLLLRRGAIEDDRWRKREETMRMLRWAVELALDTDQNRAAAGLTACNALLDSPLLDNADIQMVSTITAEIAEGLAAGPAQGPATA